MCSCLFQGPDRPDPNPRQSPLTIQWARIVGLRQDLIVGQESAGQIRETYFDLWRGGRPESNLETWDVVMIASRASGVGGHQRHHVRPPPNGVSWPASHQPVVGGGQNERELRELRASRNAMGMGSTAAPQDVGDRVGEWEQGGLGRNYGELWYGLARPGKGAGASPRLAGPQYLRGVFVLSIAISIMPVQRRARTRRVYERDGVDTRRWPPFQRHSDYLTAKCVECWLFWSCLVVRAWLRRTQTHSLLFRAGYSGASPG